LIRTAAIAAYLAALLAVDTQVELPGQLALGLLTWLVKQPANPVHELVELERFGEAGARAQALSSETTISAR